MAFAFGGINKDSTKKAAIADLIQDPVLLDKSDGSSQSTLVLLDEFYSKDKIKKISIFLEKNGIRKYRLVTALNCKMLKEELTGELAKFYRTNQSDWKRYVPTSKYILSVGAALYAINQSADIQVDHFYDFIFNKTYYWSNDTEKYVFPIDSFNDIFPPLQISDALGPVNTYKTHFAEYQCKQITSLNLRGLRKPVIQTLSYPDWKSGSPVESQTVRLIKITSIEDCLDLLNSKLTSGHPICMACDLETSGFDFVKDRIGCVTITFDGIDAFFIPWSCVPKDVLNTVFNRATTILGANFKFDIRFLRYNGVPDARVTSDTVQLGHIINEQRSNGLKAHAFFYTAFGGYDRDLDKYREKTGIDNYLEIPEEILFPYATMDVIVTWAVHEKQQKQLTYIDTTFPNEKNPALTLRRYYEEIMMPAIMSFADIECRGVYVDKDKLAESRAEILQEIEAIEQQLRQIWNTHSWFDFNSPKALGELFESLGFEDLGRSKAGDYITSDDVLERWRQNGHEEIKLLQRMRSLKTVVKTFISSEEEGIKGWERYLRYHDEDASWRMHPTYNVMRTDTGRNKCDSPNMQNIPSHGDLADKVKRCLSTPDPSEYYMCTADYASLQIRLAAIDTNINYMGKDTTLYNVYLDPKMGGDMHSRTGHAVFVGAKEFDIEVVTVSDGTRTRKFFGGEFVKTTTRGDIKARDLLPTDVLA